MNAQNHVLICDNIWPHLLEQSGILAEDTPHAINLCRAQQATGFYMLLFVLDPPMDTNLCICCIVHQPNKRSVQIVLYMLPHVGQMNIPVGGRPKAAVKVSRLVGISQ